jgi:hypothetical protein
MVLIPSIHYVINLCRAKRGSQQTIAISIVRRKPSRAYSFGALASPADSICHNPLATLRNVILYISKKNPPVQHVKAFLMILTCPLVRMVFVDAYYQRNWKEALLWVLAFIVLVPLVLWSVKTQGLNAVILVSAMLPLMLLVKKISGK